MVRTQIYIPESLHQQAKQVAKQLDTSLADLLRQYIKLGLAKDQQTSKGLDALLDLQLTGGPQDLAEHMDDYLYGDK